MSLKRRLIISNAAIVVIPVLITIAASFAYIFISTRVFNTDVGYDNIRKLTGIEYELFKANGSSLKEDPERLMEKEYQQYITERLSGINADIAIVRNHEIVFSSKKLSKIDVEKCIEAASGSFLSGSVDLDGISYIVRGSSVTFKDGKQGWTILLAPVGLAGTASEQFLWFVLIVFIASFLATNTLLAFGFSKRILQPVQRLQAAAGEISRGNLDHEVIEEGDNEIRELCRSFEQMRVRLKESVYTQMKFDDNRKMLVSSISHDLKTPITSIKGYVEGIIDGVANTPEKIEKYLKTIYSKATQVDAMIDDLLLFSKLDLNQIPFNFEKTDIVRYFEDSIAENEAELEKASIELVLQNETKGSWNVMIDRERLRRVVINIIDNARKYMNKPGGRICVLLRETNSSIIVEVNDNGSGIPQQDLPRIFDRFYRADTSRGRISGSGLGLAIAKQIVEGHGGKIWVISRENEGTSIMMSFKKVK